jgi:hypothetical protein
MHAHKPALKAIPEALFGCCSSMPQSCSTFQEEDREFLRKHGVKHDEQ